MAWNAETDSWAPGEPPVGDASVLPPDTKDTAIPGGSMTPAAGTFALPAAGASDFFGDIQGRTDQIQRDLVGPAKEAQEKQSYADRELSGRAEKSRADMQESWNYERAAAGDPALRPWNADQERSNRVRGPMEQFGSIGFIFAMAASAFTRTPMTSALNAGAAAMTAIQQGDEKAYESAYGAWKDNSALALKRFDMEHTLYEDANKLLTTDMNLWKQKTLMIATQFDDQKKIAMLNSGMDPQVLEAQHSMIRSRAELVKSIEGFEEYNFKKDSISDGIKAWKNDPEHPERKEVGDKNPTPEYVRMKMQVYSDVMAASHGALGHKVTPDQEFMQRYAAEHPNATSKEFADAFDEFKRAQKQPGGGVGARPGTPSDDHAKMDADIRKEHSDWTDTQVIEERNRRIKEEKEAKPSLSKDAIKLRANMFVKGNPAATTNVGRGIQGTADLRAITEEAAEILKERGLSSEESATLINENTAAFQGDKRGAASLALRSSQIIGASTVALNTMDRVIETSRKVSRTEFSDINKILLAGEQRTGDANVINYGIALNTLVNNYARAIGAGSNALTDTARREAHELLQQYWSHGQISSALEQMKKELHDELRGAQEARKIWQEGGSNVPGLGSGAVTGAPKAPPVNLLKEGTITTFSNGSKWTLQDGKPVQVGR